MGPILTNYFKVIIYVLGTHAALGRSIVAHLKCPRGRLVCRCALKSPIGAQYSSQNMSLYFIDIYNLLFPMNSLKLI